MARSRLVSNAARFAAQAARSATASALLAARSAASIGMDAAREAARIASYTVPTDVLSAADAGDGTATISVADHTRVYPVEGDVDVPDLALAGIADVTGLDFATTYYPYYDDTTLANPTPVVEVTTEPVVAQSGFAAGRHALGVVITPAAAGSPPTSGGGPTPGGYNPSTGGPLEPQSGI